MLRVGHIINPVIVSRSSDLFIAQPITFETMRVAQDYARNLVDVKLFSAQYSEDRPLVPSYITKTPNLNRSILDMYPNCGTRKLPFLKDILDRLFESSDAEYLIYTNVDIALAKTFYLAVSEFITEGYDAFTVARRTVSNEFKSTNDIPRMYMDKGKPHPGSDCFIFRRTLYPQFELGEVVIGTLGVGRTLLCNCMRFAKRFGFFKQEFLTYHIGEDSHWKKEADRDDGLAAINLRASLGIIEKLYRSSPDDYVRQSLEKRLRASQRALIKKCGNTK
jgi:hypothetical protein